MAAPRSLKPLISYALIRLVTLAGVVVVAVTVTIYVANMGGYVDEIVRAEIAFGVGMMLRSDERASGLSPAERMELARQIIAPLEERAGLNRPFVLRTAGWLTRALTLDWGESKLPSVTVGGRHTREVQAYIRDRLPRTLLLFGTSNILVFVASVVIALALTHRQGSRLDRIVMMLSPLSSIPPWIYGMLLTVLALQVPALRFMTARLDSWPRDFRWSYVLLIARHMLLPVLSIFLSKLAQTVFLWRTIFLLDYDEHYVELARAKGVDRRTLERRHLLRPMLPGVLTNLSLLLVALWQEVIVLEHLFRVEGVGRLLVRALAIYDIPVVLALVVVFGYLLALTVLLLDIACAVADPRIRLDHSDAPGRVVRRGAWLRRRSGDERRSPAPASPAVGPAADELSSGPSPSRHAAARRRGRGIVRDRRILSFWREFARHRSAVVGLGFIAALVLVGGYAVIAIPYEEAVVRWRADQGIVYRHPRNALPVWIDLFTADRLPRTIVRDSRTDAVRTSTRAVSEGMVEHSVTLTFDFPFDRYPQELSLHLYAPPLERPPHTRLTWRTPNGRELHIADLAPGTSTVYRISLDERLMRRLGGRPPEVGLFAPAAWGSDRPLRGTYELQIDGLFFEEPAELDAELIVYGSVFGLAGTDSRRRDLMVAVLWGTAVALSFGLLAAVGTSILAMLLAAVGAWFGGLVDGVIGRMTEVNMVLPFLPVSLMIFTLYSKSFWVILGVTVLLSIFGTGLKNYRAIFLSVKHAPYIEAALAYGAGNRRIVGRYLLPRIVPVLIPQIVVLIPGYVFLESALSFLGMSDPNLPTWGKLVQAAFASDGLSGSYHLVLAPAIVLLTLGLSAALVGYGLDRVLNPRLDPSRW